MRRQAMLLSAAVAAVIGASVMPARAAVQTYSSATGSPGTGANHPGFGFFQADYAWDDGLTGEFEFAGSDGAFEMGCYAILNGGITGATGDNAGHFFMNYNPAPPDRSFGNFWFGGVGNDIGPLPTTDFSGDYAWVDVIAPLGKPMEFRIESDWNGQGNGRKFSFIGTGTWQTVGGLLSAATPFGSMNTADPQLAALVAFGQNGNEISVVDDGTDPLNVPAVTVDNFTLTPASSTWTANADGNWGDNPNWSTLAADGANATAVFGSAISAPRTVTVIGTRFAGTVRFNNTQSYTVSGAGAVALRTIGGTSAIEVEAGNHTISSAVQLWNDATITVNPAASNLTISGAISSVGNVTMTKAGAGAAGVSNVRLAGLAVNAGTLSVLTNGTDSGTSRVGALAVGGGAALDLNDNDLIVQGGSVAAISGLIASARNGGGWDGSGITSTAARNQPQGATTLGVLSGAEFTSVNGPTFGGFSVASSDVLVKYTWYGDTDFTGVVDFDDYVRTDGGFNGGLNGWLNGDFDLSGSIDFDDYVLIDLGFNAQTGTLRRAVEYVDGTDRSLAGMDAPALQKVVEHFAQFGTDYGTHFLSAVPEPGSIGAIAGVALAALARRRRVPRAG